MKNSYLFCISLIITLLLASCANQGFSVEKRKYRKGYNIAAVKKEKTIANTPAEQVPADVAIAAEETEIVDEPLVTNNPLKVSDSTVTTNNAPATPALMQNMVVNMLSRKNAVKQWVKYRTELGQKRKATQGKRDITYWETEEWVVYGLMLLGSLCILFYMASIFLLRSSKWWLISALIGTLGLILGVVGLILYFTWAVN